MNNEDELRIALLEIRGSRKRKALVWVYKVIGGIGAALLMGLSGASIGYLVARDKRRGADVGALVGYGMALLTGIPVAINPVMRPAGCSQGVVAGLGITVQAVAIASPQPTLRLHPWKVREAVTEQPEALSISRRS